MMLKLQLMFLKGVNSPTETFVINEFKKYKSRQHCLSIMPQKAITQTKAQLIDLPLPTRLKNDTTMIKQLIIILFVLTVKASFGQVMYEPQILILAPNETKYEKSFDKELLDYDEEIKKNSNASEYEKFLNSPDFKNQPENIQIITKSEIEFSKNLNFFKQASSISEQFLVYRFYEKFPNVLIKLKDEKCNGSLIELKKQSEKEKLQYVLNFSLIELYKKDRISYAKITVELYDNSSNEIILNKSYIGDWSNPGFEFACKNQTINCTLNNALSQALDEVIFTIASNSPTLKREKQLKQERFEVLKDNYFRKTIEKQELRNIISPLDSNINVNISYQAIYNHDTTKFVAFFLEQIASQSLKSLNDNKKDNNVNIISSKDIKDKGFLDDIPKTYGYIVKGVRYNEKWYYEKSKVTYFEAKTIEEGQLLYFNNLQQWNFFKDNSTEFNPDFWETMLFDKVPDLKKDPDWEKYGESIWKTDEANNRDYIGMYEIVANNLKREVSELNKQFGQKMIEDIFKPSYQLIKTKNPDIYSKISEHSLIFSKTRFVVINPVLVTDKNDIKTIHYFVAFNNKKELYEWTYFTPLEVENNMFGSKVVEQINSLIDWNFSYKNLNDQNFWNNYVLAKSGDNYKYLKEVE